MLNYLTLSDFVSHNKSFKVKLDNIFGLTL